MTTDAPHRASPDDGQDGLPQPKKPALAEGSAPGAEPGGRACPLGHRPVVDAGDGADQGGERKDKESPRAGPMEPMDTGEAAARRLDSERALPLPPGRSPRDRAPESRPAELSLEELSISARQQPSPLAPTQPAPATAASAPRAGGHPEEPPPRPSRKRKLLEDAESGKTLLLDAYRVWQQGQKGVAYDLGRIERIMAETYMLIKQVGAGGRSWPTGPSASRRPGPGLGVSGVVPTPLCPLSEGPCSEKQRAWQGAVLCASHGSLCSSPHQ